MKLNTDVKVIFSKKIKFVKLTNSLRVVSQAHKLYYIDFFVMWLR
jgi:hypothetical protein